MLLDYLRKENYESYMAQVVNEKFHHQGKILLIKQTAIPPFS